MSANGTWTLTISSPMGDQTSTLVVTEDGATMTSPAGSAEPVENFVHGGDSLKWKASITQPIPMALHFDVTVSGDTMEGTYRPGMFPPAPVHGVRAG